MIEEGRPAIKYCLYARKSTESDERQSMSISAQVKEMLELAEVEDLNIVHTLEESHSAKASGKREVYNQLLSGIEKGEYNAVLTWAPDRLSRNAGDLGAIVDLMDQGKLVHIRTYSQTFSNIPSEKFLLMILCSQAKLENDNKSVNVKRGIRAKCEMGWRPGAAPLGYINRSFNGVKEIAPDPDRAHYITEIFNMTSKGRSGRAIKKWLDEQGFTTKHGKQISLSQVFEILNNTFYYGEFQYPEGQGEFYKGKHKPLTTKNTFEGIQKNRIIPHKVKWGSKTFAFKDIFNCGTCGANITAEEKFKALKDGSLNRHVYYRCTKSAKMPDCPERYLNEKKLIEQLIDFISVNSCSIKITQELKRKCTDHMDMVETILESRGIKEDTLDSLNEYSRFILTKGTYKQQSELVEGIRNKFVIRNRQLYVN